MEPTSNNADINSVSSENAEQREFPGYPAYPATDDIFLKFHEEHSINPEDISETKESIKKEKQGTWNEKDFDVEKTGDDLDVPGSEADDAEENIGSEDEENNYYSIGGDNHDNLEENY